LRSIGNRPSFCLEIWGADYTKIKDTCVVAEKLGYSGFFYGESLTDIDLDCWTILSNLSAVTTDIKLGPVITYLIPEYRSIALLAKQAATLQEMSNGRLEFRTGAGATPEWALPWWYPYGIKYPNNSERISMMDEGLALLHKLWKKGCEDVEALVHFSGKYFKLNGAPSKKPAKAIPITVAAMKPRTMHLAAKYADVWEASYISPQEFVSLSKKFKEDTNSNPNNYSNQTYIGENRVKKSIELDVIMADSDSDLEYKKKMFAKERGTDIAQKTFRYGLIGRPCTIAERLIDYREAGVDQFLLAFQDPLDSNALESFREVSMK
jgi:alkanesulfonate monooxygenase SsuD/methylene tetrahydromethanopterin reductase-like flavin-dependent oxidoreductase (luciferase family)